MQISLENLRRNQLFIYFRETSMFARWFGFALFVSVVGSFAILIFFGGGQPLETYIDHEKKPTMSRPADSVTVTGSPVELALYEAYGLKALASERQYPGKAARVWSLYGGTPYYSS